VKTQVKGYHAWLLILEFAMLGVFMAQDWSLFFMFWELTLIPLFFLIDLWGGEKRHAASLNFVLYTMGGAIFILIGADHGLPAHAHPVLRHVGHCSKRRRVASSGTGLAVAGLSYRVWGENSHFSAAWLVAAGSCRSAQPGQHSAVGRVVEDGRLWPAAGMAMLPQAALALQPLLVGIALVSIVYGGLLAWRQSDLKAMIAYSSVSHMGVVLLGISALNEVGLDGRCFADGGAWLDCRVAIFADWPAVRAHPHP
jgi:NADH-quinone oxidoreductase subunit M